MKAWMVCLDEGCVLVRADTRHQARTMHPDVGPYDRENYLAASARRMPFLDGEGPRRELQWVDKRCDHEEDETWNPDWGCPVCYEGYYLDREATMRANGMDPAEQATSRQASDPATPAVEEG